MKKITIILLLTLLTLLSLSSLALADNVPEIRVNASLVDFPDAQPYIDSAGRTMAPVKFIAAGLGAEVDWDKARQAATIAKNGITIEITVGQQELLVTESGTPRTVTMDTVAVLLKDRVYVPVSFIAEALGAWVGYSDYYKTISICVGQLMPADIERLQAYPFVQANVTSWPPAPYTYFDNQNGFTNSREFALRPEIIYTVKSELTGLTYSKDGGLAWGDFLAAEAAAQMGALYSYDYATDKAASTTMAWNYLGKSSVDALYEKADASVAHKALIDASFITDTSCIYQDKNVANVFRSVRGILAVTVLEPTDKTWAAKLLGLDKLEYDKQYNIDMEVKFILQINNYTKLGTLVIMEPLSGKRTINLENL